MDREPVPIPWEVLILGSAKGLSYMLGPFNYHVGCPRLIHIALMDSWLIRCGDAESGL